VVLAAHPLAGIATNDEAERSGLETHGRRSRRPWRIVEDARCRLIPPRSGRRGCLRNRRRQPQGLWEKDLRRSVGSPQLLTESERSPGDARAAVARQLRATDGQAALRPATVALHPVGGQHGRPPARRQKKQSGQEEREPEPERSRHAPNAYSNIGFVGSVPRPHKSGREFLPIASRRRGDPAPAGSAGRVPLLRAGWGAASAVFLVRFAGSRDTQPWPPRQHPMPVCGPMGRGRGCAGPATRCARPGSGAESRHIRAPGAAAPGTRGMLPAMDPNPADCSGCATLLTSPFRAEYSYRL